MTTGTARRPGGVALVVVLAYLAAIFEILAGVLVMIDSDTLRSQTDSGMTEDQLLVAGIVMIVIGAIGILLTTALARGSNVVRMLFAVWIGFQIAGGLYTMIEHSGYRSGSGIVPVVFGIAVLYLLFNRSAEVEST